MLVVGTIHSRHATNPNYSYQHLLQILTTYSPDIICVEIRPQDFRKVSYLTEMMMATIFGLNRGLKVFPIDWWSDDNVRSKRREYMETPEYKAKEKEERELIANNVVIHEFMKTYGDLDEISKKNITDYMFYNGKVYNQYVSEMYKVSMAVYGDSPINLFYKTRNKRMQDLIKQALAGNQGRRVIILTGAKHKHYFDNALAEQPGIQILYPADILPLRPATVDDNIARFLKDNLARGYFDEST